MNPNRQTSRMLHDEHRANLALLGQLEITLGRGARRDPELPRLMQALARQLQQDTGRHFEFEERELFTRLAEAGEGDIAALLTEEHDAIREVAGELLPLVQALAAANVLDDAGWDMLRQGGLELIERQVSHIQKEEMALLPMLGDLLDDDTDRELALAYASA